MHSRPWSRSVLARGLRVLRFAVEVSLRASLAALRRSASPALYSSTRAISSSADMPRPSSGRDTRNGLIRWCSTYDVYIRAMHTAAWTAYTHSQLQIHSCCDHRGEQRCHGTTL